jgi:hypothetical protein
MKELKDISEKSPFKVPENYFEEVNRKIISATAGPETQLKPKGLYRIMRPALAIAATVAIVLLLGYAALKIFLPDGRPGSIPEISLQEFSDSYLDDIDILTLEDEITPIAYYDKIPDVSNSEIIDYLMFENLDLNEIYEIL